MDIARLCSELVRIRSENPPGDTEDVVHYLKGFTDRLGIRTTIVKNRGGRCNLVSTDPQGTLLLCGHVDVVPALGDGWTHRPDSGDVDGGYVWGRGATDMKGGCASLLDACKTVADEGIDLSVDLAFVCDEETSGKYGVRCLLERELLCPCDCLIAEPCPALHPNIGQKGLLRVRFTFHGVPGHGSLYPLRGTSAIMEAYSLLEHLHRLHEREYSPGPDLLPLVTRSSEVLGEVFSLPQAGSALTRIMYNPGRIEGGEKANIVAQRCCLELELRVPWGCSTELLLQDLRAAAPGAEVVASSVADPSLTRPEERIVRLTCREISRVYGATAEPIVQWAASDARHLRGAGFRVIEYGPGEIQTLHAVDERVSIENMEKVSQVYQGIIREYCSGKD
ncbi:succinyl-diaminopimelate desuccinylase [Methanolinea mesophila]|uniref:M20/M25/M40 family metallo-hydrolase n=1 Tax=Methanolinea mesophila TaxID=547055 RepID=UPI001AE12BD5|nr:M20/M25/M40 family metallo-hydrolase [Methanolinea mesophila]MBP1927846.1 succinyl-diaminopimelate desuccinylase [Methanolinea mesophila]